MTHEGEMWPRPIPISRVPIYRKPWQFWKPKIIGFYEPVQFIWGMPDCDEGRK